MPTALVRSVPETIERCELTHLERVAISFDRARRQHEDYVELLNRLGCVVENMEALPDHADSVFVEDTVLVLDEVAVILRPGAVSRQAETATAARAISRHRPLLFLSAPATLDGGDILKCGRTLYVGVSTRSNAEGIRQLAGLVAPFDHHVVPVPIRGCLHLKSAATFARADLLVANPEWVDPGVFEKVELVTVHPDEPHGANVLPVAGFVIAAKAFPRTNERLTAHGLTLETVDLSELAKAEGAVTCCSVMVD